MKLHILEDRINQHTSSYLHYLEYYFYFEAVCNLVDDSISQLSDVIGDQIQDWAAAYIATLIKINNLEHSDRIYPMNFEDILNYFELNQVKLNEMVNHILTSLPDKTDKKYAQIEILYLDPYEITEADEWIEEKTKFSFYESLQPSQKDEMLKVIDTVVKRYISFYKPEKPPQINDISFAEDMLHISYQGYISDLAYIDHMLEELGFDWDGSDSHPPFNAFSPSDHYKMFMTTYSQSGFDSDIRNLANKDSSEDKSKLTSSEAKTSEISSKEDAATITALATYELSRNRSLAIFMN